MEIKRFLIMPILTVLTATATVTVQGQDNTVAVVQDVSDTVGNTVDKTVNQPIGNAQDFAGDIVLGSRDKAVKSGMNAFNAFNRILKKPGDTIYDSIYGYNEPLTTATMRPKLQIGLPGNEPIVVMAVSGGGSRMAYYHANIMEQLSKVPDPWGKKNSLLDRIDIISGVSGGSWSSAWYVANYARRHDPNFFEEYKDAMETNVTVRALSRLTIYPPEIVRLLTSSHTRTDTLAHVLGCTIDGKNKLTFDDLQREWQEAPVNAKPPVLIANGTILNNGGRLSMTNLPPTQLPVAATDRVSKAFSGGTQDINPPEALKPLHFEDFGSNIGTFRVGDAVAASAAYPIALPPFNLKVYRDNIPVNAEKRRNIDPETLRSAWIQVSDGGLYSNDGLDPLFSFIKTLPSTRPVLVIFVYSHDLDVTTTYRDRSWFIPAVINRMFSLNTVHLRVHQALTLYGHRSMKNTTYIPLLLQGSTPKEEKKIKDIPTTFNISPGNRKLIRKVTPQIVADQLPILNLAVQMFAGKISELQYYKTVNTAEYKLYERTID